jgi:hypothetical protein
VSYPVIVGISLCFVLDTIVYISFNLWFLEFYSSS